MTYEDLADIRVLLAGIRHDLSRVEAFCGFLYERQVDIMRELGMLPPDEKGGRAAAVPEAGETEASENEDVD